MTVAEEATKITDQLLTDNINKCRSVMYKEVHKMKEDGLLSSSNAKLLIEATLKKIYNHEAYVKDGKLCIIKGAL